jgi:hypothetical protein
VTPARASRDSTALAEPDALAEARSNVTEDSAPMVAVSLRDLSALC